MRIKLIDESNYCNTWYIDNKTCFEFFGEKISTSFRVKSLKILGFNKYNKKKNLLVCHNSRNISISARPVGLSISRTRIFCLIALLRISRSRGRIPAKTWSASVETVRYTPVNGRRCTLPSSFIALVIRKSLPHIRVAYVTREWNTALNIILEVR